MFDFHDSPPLRSLVLRPASKARLRAMARQIARPLEDDEPAMGDVLDRINAIERLPEEDQRCLEGFLRDLNVGT